MSRQPNQLENCRNHTTMKTMQKENHLYSRIVRLRWSALSVLTVLIFVGIAFTISRAAPSGKHIAPMIQLGAQMRDSASGDDEIRRIIERYAKSVDEANTTLASEIWYDSP